MKLGGGSNVTIAVIDSGYNYYDGCERILDSDFDLFGSSLEDTNGHGTELTNIILQSTSGYNIDVLPIRVVDSNGNTSVVKLCEGLKYAIEKDVDVINISLTAYKSGYSEMINNLISEAKSRGIFVVTSAGNFNDDVVNYSPANSEDAIVVSSIEDDYTKSYYSNYGDAIDFCSFGAVDTSMFSKEQKVTGTSVSASIISSYIALVKSNNSVLSYDEILDYMRTNAVDILDSGWDKNSGYGLLYTDFLKYVSSENNKIDIELPELLTCDWKNLSDEDLSEIISTTDSFYQKRFLDDLSKEDLELLLSRDTTYTERTKVLTLVDNSSSWSSTCNYKQEDSKNYDSLYDYLYSEDFPAYTVQLTINNPDDTTYYMWSNFSYAYYQTSQKGANATIKVNYTSTENAKISKITLTDGGAYDFSEAFYKGRKPVDVTSSGVYILGQVWIGGVKVTKIAHTVVKTKTVNNVVCTDFTPLDTTGDWTGGFEENDGIGNNATVCEKQVFNATLAIGIHDNVLKTNGNPKAGYQLNFTDYEEKRKTEGDPITIDRTCTEDGYTEQKYKIVCKNCGTKLRDDGTDKSNVLTAYGHIPPDDFSDISVYWNLVQSDGGVNYTVSGYPVIKDGIYKYYCNRFARGAYCTQEMLTKYFYAYSVYDEVMNDDNTTFISSVPNVGESSLGAVGLPNASVGHTVAPTAKYEGVSSNGILAYPSVMRLENKLKQYNVKIVGTPNVFDQSKVSVKSDDLDS